MDTESETEKEAEVILMNLPFEKSDTHQGIDMNKLIGIPHLFGRFCDTREGFMVVPIATLTLQADGRVTGYSHPNEGSWTPYGHGTVSAGEAFAFITSHNHFIPSSTWQQTFKGMPVGYYCDEPEMPQKMCLIPQQSSAGKAHVVYVVASCLRFYKQTVPALLEQLLAEGIEPGSIKVVVNGSEENEDEIIDGVSYAFSTHNAWEWSALYEAPLRWTFDYAMLIHDTNHIYPGFRRKVESFNQHLHWDHLPATPLARCLLGLYSHNFLGRLHPWLKKINHIDKKQGIIAEVAGELLHRAKTVLVMGDVENNNGARQAEWRETVDAFNTGSLRIRRVFPAINLHKFLHINSNPQSL